MFRTGALTIGLALLVFQPAMAQAINDKPAIDIGSGQPTAGSAQEVSWVMSTPSKSVADDFVAHFSADGYVCDLVQQGSLWVILARKPFAGHDGVDAIRGPAEAYVTGKGGTFNGGGIGTPGSIQIHRDGASTNAASASASQIHVGAEAARACFDAAHTQIMDMLRCVVPMISEDGTDSDRDKADFAIGANFVSSFMFKGMYDDFKRQGRDAELVEDVRKIAVANYKAWDRLSRKRHLSDEDIGTGLSASPAGPAAAIALVKQTRAELESLRGTSL